MKRNPPLSSPVNPDLSAFTLSECNQVIAAAEHLIAARGQSGRMAGGYTDRSFAIFVVRKRLGQRRLSIGFKGQPVFDCIWPRRDGPGWLMLDVPGSWHAELLARTDDS